VLDKILGKLNKKFEQAKILNRKFKKRENGPGLALCAGKKVGEKKRE
jgi:hypothetical protein